MRNFYIGISLVLMAASAQANLLLTGVGDAPRSSLPAACVGSVLCDLFTDTDNTLMTSHTMNVGPGWTNGNSNYVVKTNKATDQGLDGAYVPIVSDSGQSDITISADAFGTYGSVNSGIFSTPNVIGRYTDVNNFWMLQPYNGVVSIYEMNAGTFFQRATGATTLTDATTYALKFAFSGTSITAYVNGTSITSFTSSTFQTKTKHGMVFLNVGGPTNLGTFDNFVVTNP